MTLLKKCSRTDIAYLLDIDPSQVSRLKKTAGLPINGDQKSFDARAVLLWDRERDPERPQAGETAETLEPLTRWRGIRADREQFAHDLERGRYRLVEEAVESETRLITGAVHALKNMGARLAPQITGLTNRAEVERIIDLEVFAMRRLLAMGATYSSEAAAEVIFEAGGKTPQQKRDERNRKNHGKPYFVVRWNSDRGCYIDQKTGEEVAEQDVENHIKSSNRKWSESLKIAREDQSNE
jgi:hypothetical protein